MKGLGGGGVSIPHTWHQSKVTCVCVCVVVLLCTVYLNTHSTAVEAGSEVISAGPHNFKAGLRVLTLSRPLESGLASGYSRSLEGELG